MDSGIFFPAAEAYNANKRTQRSLSPIWSPGPGSRSQPLSATDHQGLDLAVPDTGLISGIYEVWYRIGRGSFGDVYLGMHTKTKQHVAIKMEKMNIQHPSLKQESRIMFELQGAPGIPEWLYYGEQGGYRVLVMELMGQNMEENLKNCGGRFSVKTVLMLADQLVTLLEHIHTRHIIHRDLKPENILCGFGTNKNTVNLADFGLAKRFRNSSNFEHIPQRRSQTKGITGTPRFASLKIHSGFQASRRDDIESLAYNLIYFYKGILPWQGLSKKTTNQLEYLNALKQQKMYTSITQICAGCPQVIRKILIHARELGYAEHPDYVYLRAMIRQAMSELQIIYDGIYDWMLPVSPLQQQQRFNDHNIYQQQRFNDHDIYQQQQQRMPYTETFFPLGGVQNQSDPSHQNNAQASNELFPIFSNIPFPPEFETPLPHILPSEEFHFNFETNSKTLMPQHPFAEGGRREEEVQETAEQWEHRYGLCNCHSVTIDNLSFSPSPPPSN